MARFYAFERLVGKVEYVGSVNRATGNRSIKGELLAFSTLHARMGFIQACPDGCFRHEIKHGEVRGLFLGIPVKELEAFLSALPIESME